MEEMKINIFLLPQKSALPQINYTAADMEKDPAYPRILRIIDRGLKDASKRKQKKCDISIDVENQKVAAVKKLLEKRGYSVFVQGVYV